MCPNTCGIRAHRINGVVVRIEGDPDNPQSWGKICAKGNAALMSLYNPQRVKRPLKRTNPEKGVGIDPKWQEITWVDALKTVSDHLKKVREEDPKKVVISTFDNQLAWLVKAWTGAYGSPNVWYGSAGFYCGNGYHPVMFLSTSCVSSDPDIKHAKYLILIGASNGSVVNWMTMRNTIETAEARMRGLKTVVIDPVYTHAAAKADEWVPIKPGTDAAFCLGAINVLINELGVYDAEFIKKYTTGPYLVGPDGRYVRDPATKKPLIYDAVEKKTKPYDDSSIKDYLLLGEIDAHGVKARPSFQVLGDHVKKYTAEYVSQITTIPPETIRRIAKEFGEAANIGGTIEIDGTTYPYRPAHLKYYKGPSQHKHGFHHCWAIQLLNVIIGAIDVPGGVQGSNAKGPGWAPREGPDGIIVPGGELRMRPAYPARKARRPLSAELIELFPIAAYTRPMMLVNLLEPRFGLPYTPEILINCRNNIMMATANPKQVEEALRKIKLIVCFANELNETAEMADIVLPDTHFLERLDAVVNGQLNLEPGDGYWYWHIRQPVAKPAYEARNWAEVLFDLADRSGFLEDLYEVLNVQLNLKEANRLQVGIKYPYEDIIDRMLRNKFGDEHGLDYFKKNLYYIQRKKTPDEAYPRPFVKGRIPLIYLEYLIDVAKDVKNVVDDIGIPDWDVSDYTPLPEFKPCPANAEKKPDELLLVNWKIPYAAFSYSSNNPWLAEIIERDPYAYFVNLNTETGRKLGLKDGDRVWVEEVTHGLKVSGVVNLTETIHPEVCGIAGCFGAWSGGKSTAKGRGIHWNSLIPIDFKRIDMVGAALDVCSRVKVYKV